MPIAMPMAMPITMTSSSSPSLDRKLLQNRLSSPRRLKLNPTAPPGGFQGIVFEGGGVKGMAYVGALQALEDKGITAASMKYFAGSSAGSIVAAMLAAGVSVKDLEESLYSIDWQKVEDGPSILIMQIYNLVQNLGINKGEYLEKLIEELLKKKTGTAKITFKQLYDKTGNELRVTATNLTDKKLEIFDRHSHAGMAVSKAVYISSCVPLFFRPVKYEDKYYVDGGTLRSLDLTAFEDSIKPSERALAMDLVDEASSTSKITNIVSFLRKFIATLVKYANLYDSKKPENIDVVPIDTTGIDALNFNISRKEQEELYEMGMKAVEAALSDAGEEEEEK